jgi:ferredoxin
VRIDVDRTACRGHGLCAGLLPEAVTLDDWGFPVVAPDLPPGLARAARRTVAACPTLALRLSTEEESR